jgi:hypothetical protein
MKSLQFALLFASGLFVGIQANSAFAQGNLTPPAGSPTPTMKTLDQVEPRTPIDAKHTPGDATNMFVITQPGSYYLTTNLVATGSKNGINILTNDVSIDLKGFSIVGNGVTNTSGITCPTYSQNFSVCDGSIRNWGQAGIYLYSSNSRFEKLKLSNVGQYGIFAAGDTCQIRNCGAIGYSYIGFEVGNNGIISESTAYNNNSSIGFLTGENSVVTACVAEWGIIGFSTSISSTLVDCAASFNGTGFRPDIYSTLKNCSALFCKTNGIDGGNAAGSTLIGCTAGNCSNVGIVADDDSTISTCTSHNNVGYGISTGAGCTITGCTANGNGSGTIGIGILTGIRANVSNCTANDNQSDGIRVGGDSIVRECHASHNGKGGSAAGIRTLGAGSRIDGNQVRDNVGTGILAGSSDVVIRNSAGGNTTQYSPSSGSNFAPIQTPATATNPMANISF